MFNFKKKAPKKPAKKAAGAKAPAAPTHAKVANTDKKPEVHPEPTPVVVVQPVPEPVIQPNPEPPARPPAPTKAAKPIKGLTPEEEQLELEKQIASLQARIYELQHPFAEFPKMVTAKNGVSMTFNSRKEQDAAGPEYADKK
jgi:hypothetical protein